MSGLLTIHITSNVNNGLLVKTEVFNFNFQVMEVNSRTFYQVNGIEGGMRHNGDRLRALMNLQQGIPVEAPAFKFIVSL